MLDRLLALSFVTGALGAQSLQLASEVLTPHSTYANTQAGGYAELPVGPVQLPVILPSFWGTVVLSASGGSIDSRINGSVQNSHSSGGQSQLLTRVHCSSPARLTLAVQHGINPGQFGPGTAIATLDIGHDGTDEFVSTIPVSPPTSFVLHADSRGTPVFWTHYAYGNGGLLQSFTSQFWLSFMPSVPETTYGPVCEGELGCQRGASTFDRIFVASLPADTTYAWLMGGDRQWNVQFPGFACPLLVDPQFVLAVPLFDGPNGRKFVDFEGPLPAIPGLVFYAQGIAIAGNTFVGTNGVRIQT